MLVMYDGKIIGWWKGLVRDELEIFVTDSAPISAPISAAIAATAPPFMAATATVNVKIRKFTKRRVERSIFFEREWMLGNLHSWNRRSHVEESLEKSLRALATHNPEMQRAAALSVIAELAPHEHELRIMLQRPCRPETLLITSETGIGIKVQCCAIAPENLDDVEFLFLRDEYCPVEPSQLVDMEALACSRSSSGWAPQPAWMRPEFSTR